MNQLERVLLYAVAFSFGAMLIFDGSSDGNETPQETRRIDVGPAGPVENPSVSEKAPARVRVPISRSRKEEPPRTPEIRRTDSALVLVDQRGKPRIELNADVDGFPRISLFNDAGTALMLLGTGRGDSAEITLVKDNNRASIKTAADGSLSISLRSAKGTTTQIHVASDGGAEIAMRQHEANAGPSLSLLPSGDARICLQAADGTIGPSLRMFRDGLAEISVAGSSSESGASLVRHPDGVTAIAIRSPNGNPAASMVVAADGTVVVAATSKDGKQQAAMRVDAKGRAGFTLTEPNEKKPAKPKQKTPGNPPKSVL